MGWIAVLFIPLLLRKASAIFLALIVLGGIFYSIGTLFYKILSYDLAFLYQCRRYFTYDRHHLFSALDQITGIFIYQDLFLLIIADMGIDLGRRDRAVTQDILDIANIYLFLKQ